MSMYNCIPMHTLQTMHDMPRVSEGARGLVISATVVFFAFIVAIASTI